MYQLFEPIYRIHTPVSIGYGIEYIKRTYLREISHIRQHYQDRTYYIDNQHVLVRLLNVFAIRHQVPLDRFIEIANTRGPYVAKALNFTSSINYGRLHDGCFYNDCKEVLISLDEDLNPYNLPTVWQDIQAVKVLDHPVSDLGLQLPDGRIKSSAQGMATISINIPLLLYQYRCFQLERYTTVEYDAVLDANDFVSKYVIPNMLYTHIDLVVFNRLMNLWYGAPMSVPRHRYSFLIVDYRDKLDQILTYVIRNIHEKRVGYDQYLQNIPSITQENMMESLEMPDLAKTRQVWWGLLITRLKHMKLLMDISAVAGRSSNRAYINQLQISLKRIKNEHIMSSVLSEDLRYDVESTIDEILSF